MEKCDKISNKPQQRKCKPIERFKEISVKELKQQKQQQETGIIRTRSSSSISQDKENKRCCTKSAACETFSKQVRKKVHLKYYDLGLFIQKHDFVICFLSILLLALCLIPLKTKNLKVDTDIEELWIASSGRLFEELNYTQSVTKRKGFGGEEDFGYEVFMQVAKDEDENVLTKEGLIEHLNILMKVQNEIVVHHQGVEWNLNDICGRYEPGYFGTSTYWARFIEKLTPCLIMTPLDCFWEGSIIASYSEKNEKKEEGMMQFENYKSFDPRKSLEYLKKSPKESDKAIYKDVKRFVDKIGLGAAYMDRPCFGSNLPECPDLTVTDIPAQFKGGCFGVAKNYMRWPEDLIVSRAVKNSSGYIKRSQAIQSVIVLKSASELYHNMPYDKSLQTATVSFNLEDAKIIIEKWQKKFTEFINSFNKKKEYKSKMLAFSKASFKELIKEYGKINDNYNTYLGLTLLALYTVMTFKRWSSLVFSYGLVGVAGVVFCILSVLSGIGLSYLANMNLSAISIQVLPYLSLGLGLDHMFLLARTYLFVCDARKFKCNEIMGMCLGEVGFDITLASIANTVAFLMASLIPIGSVQTFARQAAIIYTVNWFTVIFTFSSFLSFDVKRQKNRHFDMLCCCKSGEDVEPTHTQGINDNNNISENNLESQFQYIFPGTQDIPPIIAEGFINIQPPYQAQSENKFGREGRNAKTNFCPNENVENGRESGMKRFSLNRARQARCMKEAHRTFNITERDREERKKKKQKKQTVEQKSQWKDFMFKMSLTYFAQRYYGRWMEKSPVKATILVLFTCQIIISGYGTAKVENGLQISAMLPEGTYQHDFIVARQKYFSYYQTYIVTRNNSDGSLFNYSSKENQKLLYEFYNKLNKIPYVLRTYKNSSFWLPVFRDWLLERIDILKKENKNNSYAKCGLECQDRQEDKDFLRMMMTGYRGEKENLFKRILVDEKGYIEPDIFFLALSVWYNSDSLGIWKSDVEIIPTPRNTVINSEVEYEDSFKAAPTYIRIPLKVHNLKRDEDYVKLIKEVRLICGEFRDRGLYAYPTGIPFTYWEQLVWLDFHLAISVLVVLTSVFSISFVCLLNFRAAVIITSFLGLIFFESYAFLGLCSIKLSAISLIPLMLSMGVGTQFVVHSVIAFINTPGTRNRRMRGSLEIMFASVVDCSISSIIMISLMITTDYESILRYFVHLMLWIIFVATFNALCVLPIMLSLLGPCPESLNAAVAPAPTPRYFVKFPDGYKDWEYYSRSRHSLSTIPEEHSCLNDDCSHNRDSQRPATPFMQSRRHSRCSMNSLRNSNISLEDFDDDGLQETSFSPKCYAKRSQTPVTWHKRPTNRPTKPNPSCRRPMNSKRKNNFNSNYSSYNRRCGKTSSQHSETLSDSKTSGTSPTIVHVQTSDYNRVTTKFKATWYVEYETSHPCTPQYE